MSKWNLEWMYNVTKPSKVKDWVNPLFTSPWSLDFDGDRYAIVTDGYIFAAFLTDSDFPDAGDHASILTGFLQRCLANKPLAAEADLSSLKRLVGPAYFPESTTCETCKGEQRIRCTKCNGSGEIECECFDCSHVHYVACNRCDETGKMICPDCEFGFDPLKSPTPVKIGSRFYNAKLVSRAIGMIPEDRCKVFIDREHEGMLICFGDDWLSVIMPIRTDQSHLNPAVWSDFPSSLAS